MLLDLQKRHKGRRESRAEVSHRSPFPSGVMVVLALTAVRGVGCMYYGDEGKGTKVSGLSDAKRDLRHRDTAPRQIHVACMMPIVYLFVCTSQTDAIQTYSIRLGAGWGCRSSKQYKVERKSMSSSPLIYELGPQEQP